MRDRIYRLLKMADIIYIFKDHKNLSFTFEKYCILRIHSSCDIKTLSNIGDIFFYFLGHVILFQS